MKMKKFPYAACVGVCIAQIQGKIPNSFTKANTPTRKSFGFLVTKTVTRTRETSPGLDTDRIYRLRALDSIGGGAWPFLAGGTICMVNSYNKQDSGMLTSYATPKRSASNFLEGFGLISKTTL